jgi:hypothetical protein
MRRSFVLAVLVVAFSCATAAFAAPSTSTGIAGVWSGRYSGAVSGTFTLRWSLVRSKLRGTIVLSNPRGTYGISGSVARNKINFGAVKVGAVYTGHVFGSKMTGTWKSRSRSGAVIGGSWSAVKVSRG